MTSIEKRVGFMQGRLTRPEHGRIQYFPMDGWETEFKEANRLAFNIMEWTLDNDPFDLNQSYVHQILIRLNHFVLSTTYLFLLLLVIVSWIILYGALISTISIKAGLISFLMLVKGTLFLCLSFLWLTIQVLRILSKLLN